jgi:hypothetical protein
MADKEDNYVGILLEEIRDQNKAVLEAVGDMQTSLKKMPTNDRFTDLQEDVKVIKAAVTDMGRQQQDHEIRLSNLEAA